jgi:hypothetical protein
MHEPATLFCAARGAEQSCRYNAAVARLPYRLFTAAAACSLLLFTATAGAWADAACRSEWSPRNWRFEPSGVNVTLGRVAAFVHVGPYERPGGLSWRVAYWKVLAITALVPVMWFRHTRSLRSRQDSRLCPACGYDLRATPDRCPECGTDVKADAAAPPREGRGERGGA